MVFKTFYAKVYNFALGLVKNEADADDIVQIVFLKIWLKRAKLTEVKNLDTYIYTITKNTVLNFFSARKDYHSDISKVSTLHIGNESPIEQIEAQDLQLMIDMVVSNMPPQRQTIYRMSREEGLSNEEIATKMGIQKKTVENHLNLALKDIRKLLKILILFF